MSKRLISCAVVLASLGLSACGEEEPSGTVQRARRDSGADADTDAGSQEATDDHVMPALDGGSLPDADAGEQPDPDGQVPPLCNAGDSRAGTTACGLNGRGVLSQACSEGAWTDSDDCADPDECSDGAEASTPSACGLNARGSLVRTCVSGHWDEGVCSDADVCTDDADDPETSPCGLNERGTLSRHCVAGAWEETCTDPDLCVDGSEQVLSSEANCEEVRACVGGAWGTPFWRSILAPGQGWGC